MGYLDLLPLDNFLNRLFLPALARCSREQGRLEHDANFARLILFETLSWLAAGVKLGVFPQEPAQALCTQYFPPLNEQYQLFSKDIAYLLPEEESLKVQAVLEAGYLAAPESRNDSPAEEQIASRLQIVLELMANANRDQSLRSMATAILLLDASNWETLRRQITLEAISGCLQGNQNVWMDGNRGFAFTGVFRAIDHIETLIDMLDHNRRPANVDFAAWGLLRETVYRAQRWRFNLRNEAYYERFEALSLKVVQEMDRNYGEAFSLYLPELRRRWGALEGLVAGAGS